MILLPAETHVSAGSRITRTASAKKPFFVDVKPCDYSQWSFEPKYNNYYKLRASSEDSGPEVIKLFSCSTQLSMNFFLLINVEMPTIVGILTFMNGKNSILCLSELKKSQKNLYFYTYVHLKFHAQLS